jgi:subfamily B ATP-binding cassette protein MsbA
VQAALANLMQGRTVLVIAHRLGTIRRANRIAVLEEGRITAIGPHEELLNTSPTYQRLYQLQFMDVPEPLETDPPTPVAQTAQPARSSKRGK